MNLHIVTAIYGRDALTKIVLQYYSDLAELLSERANVSLLCCGSLGEHSRNIAESCGWDYVEAPNAPLSQKFNALFGASEQYSPDLTVLVGSDDLISPEIFWYYLDNVKPTERNLVGLTDLYFYSIAENRCVHFPGYGGNSPKTIGAGRCFSRYVLETMEYNLWGKEILPRGLDTASTIRMKRAGIYETAVTMQQTGGIGVDIKDAAVSLTPFGRVQMKSTDVPVSILEQAFPVEMQQVYNMPKSRIFEPYRMYKCRVVNPKHPLYGKQVEYSGTVIQKLLIEQKIEMV